MILMVMNLVIEEENTEMLQRPLEANYDQSKHDDSSDDMSTILMLMK